MTGRRQGEVRARLRVLATTDLHLHLLPHDYYADRPLATGGLARAARLIRRLRAQSARRGDATLLLDNGDFLQGNLLSDWLAGEGLEGPHPMIAAMNALGFDAATLGNHEFDHGLPALSRALADAAFPVVAANVGARDGPLAAPWVILARAALGSDGARHAVRVGVIGFAPPQVASWDRLALGDAVRARDVLDAAADEVPRLKAAGADVVVALCHSGIGAASPEAGMENAAVPLAAIPGIDAVVAGHTHVAFPGEGVPAGPAVDPLRGRLHGKPAVQPGFHGSHVGVLDLDLRGGPGAWRVAGGRARALAVGAGRVDAAVAAAAAPTHARLRAAARRPVGRTAVPLSSHFSVVASDHALDVVADAQRRAARALLDGTPDARLPVLAAVAPFKTGGRSGSGHFVDVPAGPVLLREAAGLYLHPNSFVLLEVTGADLLDWLERSAAAFRTLRPGVDQPLLDPAFPSYNFDSIDGLTYSIDPSRPPRTDAEGHVLDAGARRVGDLRHEGREVAPGDRFALATNSYRAGGGGRFEAATRARVIAQAPRAVRDLVLAALRAGPLDPAPRPRWRFAALPGTRAWFDSAPEALAHLAGVTGRDVRPLGPAPDGFWRFEIAL